VTGELGQDVPPDETCDMCGARVPGRGRFCPYCGMVKPSSRVASTAYPPGWAHQGGAEAEHRAQYREPPMPQRRAMVKTAIAITMLTFLLHFAFTVVMLVYGVGIVLPEIVLHEYGLYIVLWEIITVLTISGDGLGIYYLLLVGAILASVAYWFLTGLRGYLKELTMKAPSRKHSPIFEVCGLMFAILFLNTVVVLLIESFGGGVPIPMEDAEVWELLFVLANASVWEELVTRVLLIGVPMVLVDVVRSRIRSRKTSYILGGGFEFGMPEVALILISATVFGVAHVPSWGWWKLFPSAVAGAAFGYLFLRHGLATAIVLHFAFDYLSAPLLIFDNNLALAIVTGIGILVWLGFGALMAGYYIVRILEFLTGKKYFERRAQIIGAPFPLQAPPQIYDTGQWGPPSPRTTHDEESQRPPAAPDGHPSPSGGFGIVYICPVCGNREARWAEGRYQCLRCGRLS
jgi:hypothetical protein